MNAGQLTSAHIGQHVVIRIGTAKTKDRVAGEIRSVVHHSDGTTVTLRRHLGFDAPCLSHDDQIELKEQK